MNLVGLEGVDLSALDSKGIPFFLFTPSLLRHDLSTLSSALTRSKLPVSVYYSGKTNSFTPILSEVLSLGHKIEILGNSDGKNAIRAGASGENLLLSGAAWQKQELEQMVRENGIRRFTVDSAANGAILRSVLKDQTLSDNPFHISLRINDGQNHLGFPANASLLSDERKKWGSASNIRWGLHCHSNEPIPGTKDAPDAKRLSARWRFLAQFAKDSLLKWNFLNLGGGLLSPWSEVLSGAEVGQFHDPATAPQVRAGRNWPLFSQEENFNAAFNGLADCMGSNPGFEELWIEPGRSVVSRALHGILEVTQVKTDLYPNHQVVITNGHTAALGPLHREVHPYLCLRENQRIESAEMVPTFVYGCLPHGGDWLLQNEMMPQLKQGDKIAFLHLGAYFLPLYSQFGFDPWPILDTEGKVLA
jgi:diaminopimelate decarboxylase